MSDDINIPPEALEAAYNARRNGDTLEDICLAMLKAWPGIIREPEDAPDGVVIPPMQFPYIILPLPKEGE